MGEQLDFHVRFDLLPVGFLQQFAFELTQLAFGGSDDVQGSARSQIIQIVLAGHPPVHRPYPFGAAVLGFHPVHDVLHCGDVSPVARKDLIGQRQAFGGHHQTDAYLLAVRALISTVAAPGLRVALALPFEIGAGHVVEQKLEAAAKQTLVALPQMSEQLLPHGKHLVESAV